MIPAMLLPGITVVISPLVSLMEDQLSRLPPALPGACLSGKQSAVATANTIRALKENRLKVLFISPERLFSSSFQRLPVGAKSVALRQVKFPRFSSPKDPQEANIE